MPSLRLQRTLLLALLALAGLLPLPDTNSAHAQASTTFRSNTAISAQQFRGTTGNIARRTVDERLQTTVVSANHRLQAFVSARFRFDHAAAATPDWPLGDERQLEPSLESAWLTWRPLQAISLRTGRQDLLDSHLPARIDGARLDLELPAHLRLSLVAGLRTDSLRRRVDDPAFDLDHDPETSAQAGAGNLLAEVQLAWTRPLAAMQLTVRDERAVRDDLLFGRRIGANLRLGRLAAPHINTLYRHHLLLQVPEKAQLSALVPLKTGRRLELGAALDRVILPFDSPFIIFGTGASADAFAALDLRSEAGHRFAGALVARTTTTDPTALPWRGDARALLGARTSASGNALQNRMVWDTTAQFFAAPDGVHQRVQLGGGTAWALRRGPDLQARIQAQYAFDDRAGLTRRQWGLWSLAGARFRISDFMRVDVVAQAGVDNGARVAIRSLVLADILLPGYQP
ncbi:MAG: hypothetical protein KGO50_08445 [Myxococcales bacterium]|nr:hypothetical protein [Myxococcales bacterium]